MYSIYYFSYPYFSEKKVQHCVCAGSVAVDTYIAITDPQVSRYFRVGSVFIKLNTKPVLNIVRLRNY
jgi:hypothetical protein